MIDIEQIKKLFKEEVNKRCCYYDVREEELYHLLMMDEISHAEFEERLLYYSSNLEWVRGESELSMKGSTMWSASSDELLLIFMFTRLGNLKKNYKIYAGEHYNHFK